MKVKVMKCYDTKGNHIANVEAFEGSVHVYSVRTYPDGSWIAGTGIYQTDLEEEIFDGFEDAAKIPAGKLRGIAMEAMLEMFPTLYLTDFRFGRVAVRDAERYFGI